MSTYLPQGPQPHLFCAQCGKHFMMCGCTGLTRGEDMFYVLPQVPTSMPFQQRLERWAELIRFHPQVNRFNAGQFVQDLPSTFRSDMESIRPEIERLMTDYKNSANFQQVGVKLGVRSDDSKGQDQLREDCDLAVENFFSGNWGYIKLLEYILLNNAIQMTDPLDFGVEVRDKIQTFVEATGGIADIYSALGVKNLNWQLEDMEQT